MRYFVSFFSPSAGSLWGASGLQWFTFVSRGRPLSHGCRVWWLDSLGCHCYGLSGLSGMRCVCHPGGGLSVRWGRGSQYIHYHVS